MDELSGRHNVYDVNVKMVFSPFYLLLFKDENALCSDDGNENVK